MRQMQDERDLILKNFANLQVWRKAMDLTCRIYDVVEKLPRSEEFHLKSQLIRSTSSISANLAEGNGQFFKKKEYTHYNIALGSANESINWIILARRRDYISEEEFQSLEAEYRDIIRMIVAMMKKLRQETA
jgi:four helix bundle protein